MRWEGRAGAGDRSREAAARQDGGDLGRFNAAGFAGAGVAAAGDLGPPVSTCERSDISQRDRARADLGGRCFSPHPPHLGFAPGQLRQADGGPGGPGHLRLSSTRSTATLAGQPGGGLRLAGGWPVGSHVGVRKRSYSNFALPGMRAKSFT